MTQKYHMGRSLGRIVGYQCPNCSDLQSSPKHHKYNMVKFDFGEIEVKCPNCGAILTREVLGLNNTKKEISVL